MVNVTTDDMTDFVSLSPTGQGSSVYMWSINWPHYFIYNCCCSGISLFDLTFGLKVYIPKKLFVLLLVAVAGGGADDGSHVHMD